jgi:hypothetical protein
MPNRRDVLIGLMATGALAATGAPALAASARVDEATQPLAARPLRLLVCGRGEDAAFIAGARAVPDARIDVVRLSAPLHDRLGEFVRLLEQSRGMRLGALLDDGDAIVLEAYAVRGGGRILATGSHVRADARSLRHVIRASHHAAGLAMTLSAPPDLWAARLGESFATIAAGSWPARALDHAPAQRSQTPESALPASAHSASLLLEV